MHWPNHGSLGHYPLVDGEEPVVSIVASNACVEALLPVESPRYARNVPLWGTA